MKNINEIINNTTAKVKSIWTSPKGRVAIVSGGSLIAGCVIIALVFSNVTEATAAGNTASTFSSTSSISVVSPSDSKAASSTSSLPIVSASSAPSGAAPTEAEAAHTIPVTSVDFNHTSLTLIVGVSARLTANITPSNATDKSLSWTSTNNVVATVDGNGTVTARSPGMAYIRAANNDGQRDTCTVTVTSNSSGTSSDSGKSNTGSSSKSSSSSSSSSGVDAAHYTRVDETRTYTDEITGITQTVHFQGVGFSNEVAGGYADINTTAAMGALHYGLATVSLTGSNGIHQGGSTAGIAKSGQDGTFTFSNLTAGTYTLQLTAHDGTVVARYHFTVDSTGHVD